MPIILSSSSSREVLALHFPSRSVRLYHALSTVLTMGTVLLRTVARIETVFAKGILTLIQMVVLTVAHHWRCENGGPGLLARATLINALQK